MIVPMIKYAFLIYHRDFDGFLLKLQELGVVDIIKENRSMDEEERLILNQINRYASAIKTLQTRPACEQAPKPIDGERVLAELEMLMREKEQREASVKKAQKEWSEVKPWGDFDPEAIADLARKGLKFRFYTTAEKTFSPDFCNEVPIEVVNHEAGLVYFVLVSDTDINLPFEAQEVKPPQFSYRLKEEEIEANTERLRSIEQKIDALAAYLDALRAEQAELINQLEIKSVVSNTARQAGETLMVLQGWVPEPRNADLVAFLDQESIIYLAEKAKLTDNAPILLKNNRFARLFEPIGKLFTNPIYGELDLTPFFAPFFMLFFGFCFGDAGYGLLFVIFATLYKFKAKSEIKPLLTLVQLLGISTVVFGVLTGTLFGVSLIEANIPMLEEFKKFFFDQNKMFQLALAVGGLQIIFGMCVKAGNLWKQFGWKNAVSTIGWIVFIVSTAIFYGLSASKDSNVKLFGPAHLVFAVPAALAIFLFNSPGKNVFLNFGIGLWDSYNMLTGLLGDILSYIRLFALGLSSGILGSVFNSLAFGMAPDLPVAKQVVIVLILLIGHSINIFMSALGSLVHPMRLTFVEFYKNAGFTGGGKSYEPFQKKHVNQ